MATLHSGDSAPLTAAVAGAQAALSEAEAAAVAAEAAQNNAAPNSKRRALRSVNPKSAWQRLETEAQDPFQDAVA